MSLPWGGQSCISPSGDPATSLLQVHTLWGYITLPSSVLLTIHNWNSWNQFDMDFSYWWAFIDWCVARCLASYPLNAQCMYICCFFLHWTQHPIFPAFPGNVRKLQTLGDELMSQVLWYTAHACWSTLPKAMNRSHFTFIQIKEEICSVKAAERPPKAGSWAKQVLALAARRGGSRNEN